jgi:hypothetical protein
MFASVRLLVPSARQRYRLAGEELEPDESVRYTAYLSAFFAFLEEIFLLHQFGTYEENLGDSCLTIFHRNDCKHGLFLRTPAARCFGVD